MKLYFAFSAMWMFFRLTQIAISIIIGHFPRLSQIFYRYLYYTTKTTAVSSFCLTSYLSIFVVLGEICL